MEITAIKLVKVPTFTQYVTFSNGTDLVQMELRDAYSLADDLDWDQESSTEVMSSNHKLDEGLLKLGILAYGFSRRSARCAGPNFKVFADEVSRVYSLPLNEFTTVTTPSDD